MTEDLREGRWHAARVIAALGKIGYDPVSAVLDMVDNSVSNSARRVAIKVQTQREEREGRGRRRTYVSGFEIIDNGCGMTAERLDDAIALGSSDEYYPEGTLSKFGMGLKSASASLGRRLVIISRGSDGESNTAVLDQDVIVREHRYVYSLRTATADEVDRLDSVAAGASGTLIEITKIHEESMISPAEIISRLQSDAGVVYFFSLSDIANPLVMTVNDQEVTAKDPLFVSEISDGEAGDLDEYSWDGISVRWIQHTKPIQLNEDGTITAKVTMTQLPHPPSVARATEMSQAQCRERYMIGARHYGFYIYRNGRLISWADSLGMVPQDQDLYSFRGRLEIGSDADEVLNIDVTKSRINLSDIAREQLTPLLREGVKKSKAAWDMGKRRVQRQLDTTPHDSINEDLSRIGELDEEGDRLDESAAPVEERNRLEKRREKAIENRGATEDEQRKLKDYSEVVQYVDTLDNNQLWERAHDPSRGLIVRVNRSHRLFRELVEAQMENGPLVKMWDIILFGLARGEYATVYKSDLDEKSTEASMDEFRERVGAELSEIVRRLDVSRIIAAE